MATFISEACQTVRTAVNNLMGLTFGCDNLTAQECADLRNRLVVDCHIILTTLMHQESGYHAWTVDGLLGYTNALDEIDEIERKTGIQDRIDSRRASAPAN